MQSGSRCSTSKNAVTSEFRSLEVIENDTYVYPRDVVSGVLATATGLGGWLGGWLSVTAGIVSKRLNLS